MLGEVITERLQLGLLAEAEKEGNEYRPRLNEESTDQ